MSIIHFSGGFLLSALKIGKCSGNLMLFKSILVKTDVLQISKNLKKKI